MPVVATKNFGRVEYEAEAVFEFPRGLPGFEKCRGFLVLRQPENDPLVFLQSVERPELCFVTVPVLVVDPAYRLAIETEDAGLLELRTARPRIGEQVLCLAVLAIREEGVTANLLAPIVVNPANRKGVQAVVAGAEYSHQHRLCAEEAVACS